MPYCVAGSSVLSQVWGRCSQRRTQFLSEDNGEKLFPVVSVPIYVDLRQRHEGKDEEEISLALGIGVTLALFAGIGTMKFVLNEQGISMDRETMRATLLEAENVRESMPGLTRRGAFDETKLAKEIASINDLRQTTVYETVPVVAAWRAAGQSAKVQGFEFRVMRSNLWNPANAPNEREWPVTMTQDCLACHGDAAMNGKGDGKDSAWKARRLQRR